jgi:hypothetical protein
MPNFEEIRSRLINATPGSWTIDSNGRNPQERGYDVYTTDGVVASELYRQDAELVANAPTYIMNLMAEIVRLNSELEKYKAALANLFLVTPATNAIPTELMNIEDFKEKHAEAIELAKELLWDNK